MENGENTVNEEVLVAGRVIARRKSSKNLIFLDLESDGSIV
jgi:lysyl-tRNA synthetase class II